MVKKVTKIAEYLYKECNWRKQLYWPRLQRANTARMNEDLSYKSTGNEALASISAHNDAQHANEFKTRPGRQRAVRKERGAAAAARDGSNCATAPAS
jgi:hypothetical protein